MGRAITYCVQCSARVSDADFDAGKAVRVGDRILCRACAPETARPQTTKKVSRPKDASTSVRLKVQPSPPAAPMPGRDRRKKLLLLGGGAAAIAILVLVILVVILVNGEPPPVVQPPQDPTPPTTPVDPKVAASKADLEKARAFAKAHPDDPGACMKEFNDLVWKHEGTEAAAEAAKEAAAIKSATLEKVKGWMDEVEVQIKGLIEKGEHRAAARKVEELKPAHNLIEWRQAVEKRASELFTTAVREEEKRKAEEERLAAENPPKLPEKTVSEEARGYPAKWEAAVGRASARDFTAAVAELERVVAGLKETDVRAEADQDLKDLKDAAALHKASLDVLKKKARGAGLSLLVRQPSGELKRIGGQILRIDAERVEVAAGKTTAFVEWEDVASPTLAELAAGKPDPRIQSVLCLLDGEIDAARAYKQELTPKWWTYAARAKGLLPKPDPGEKSARELFYSAERGFRSMETRAAAIDGYRTLRTDFGSTALVKAYPERIARRMESGREYYFAPADFHVEGTFRRTKAGKLESASDSDDPDTLRNLAEIEFAALAGVTYRCWLWAGACCEETFLFYLQGTEVTDTDPKTRKKLPCDPGSSVASPVKHSIRGLKKTHAEHKAKGAKEHPKTAARWEWIEIPLPKYAAAGGKKLRFMTNQAGFSIGSAVVSSTRKAAPAEAELKDLEKDRDVPESLPVDADLVAWWTFEEGGGDRAVDMTGKGHDAKMVGAVQWVEGAIGGGVRFTAPGQALRVEDAEDLRIPGDLTLAFWMKMEAVAADWTCLLGKGVQSSRNYGLWLERESRLLMFQRFGGASVDVRSTTVVQVGTWIHVAATVGGGRATVYINGARNAEVATGGEAAVQPSTLGIGLACDHTTFLGLMDDVRLYRRVLTPDEVRGLFQLAGR